jgi:hypothetical protein
MKKVTINLIGGVWYVWNYPTMMDDKAIFRTSSGKVLANEANFQNWQIVNSAALIPAIRKTLKN